MFARAFALASALLLSACVAKPVQVSPPITPPPTTAPPGAVQPIPPIVPPPPANGKAAGAAVVPPPAALSEAAAVPALQAFLATCPSVTRRQDRSGLASPAEWSAVCAEARAIPSGAAAAFFLNRFDWVRVGDGKAFATGYYEPEIIGSRVRAPGYEVPIYRAPPDLVRCTRPDGGTGRGRIAPDGTCVLYFTRAEIQDGALANRGLELAWAADPIDLFFLEIQGSGRVRLPDGSVMRIGYASQNGREYLGIGRLLRERGILPPGGANMESIKAWLRTNPEPGRALMRENLSYVFFRELDGPPLGALNVAVTPRVTVATDPAFVPLGAPVFLTLDRPEANGLWVAQDTGGAIKGANRFDTFWGAGPEAEGIAGPLQAKGRALLLMPRGTLQRLASGAPAQP